MTSVAAAALTLASSGGGGAIGTIFVLALFWGLPIAIAKGIGDRRGRNGWVWALFLGWIGVLIVVLLPRRKSAADTVARAVPSTGATPISPESGAVRGPNSGAFGTRAMRQCPECAEEIRAEARICRYCGNRIDPAAGVRV